MYAKGEKGVQQDFKQAAAWHRKAADQELAEAQYVHIGIRNAEISLYRNQYRIRAPSPRNVLTSVAKKTVGV
jgi:hypothetical protein